MGVETTISHPQIENTPLSPDVLTSQEAINRRRELGEKAIILGRNSEARVEAALRTIPYISELRVTEPSGEEDAQMIDIFVAIQPHHTDYLVSSVKVQVKSSRIGIHEYKKTTLKKHVEADEGKGNGSVEQREKWLRKNRLMIINGGYEREGIPGEDKQYVSVKRPVTDEEIISSFTSQLTDIVNFARENGHPVANEKLNGNGHLHEIFTPQTERELIGAY